jgi:hypothetical protein
MNSRILQVPIRKSVQDEIVRKFGLLITPYRISSDTH